MANFNVGVFAIGSIIAVAYANQSGTPFQMSWSSKSYGPDGPWQAVSVSIGSSSQGIDLYPGGVWASQILTNSICENTTVSATCYADTVGGGLFDPSLSTTYNDTVIQLYSEGQLPWGLGEVAPIGYGKNTFDSIDIGGISVPAVSMQTIEWVYQQYPSGKQFPLAVGVLSLGANAVNQTFSETAPTPAINTTFVDSYVYTNGGGHQTPSYSFGMHIGSAALSIPGSLMFGGYDQSRVLGNVSAQAYDGATFPIELRDIGLGVAEGDSPWTFASKSGLLASGNSSIGQTLSVLASPPDPYIYLPRSACDAIAANLPVTYNEDLNLYYWNTTSSQYTDIVSSPAYLSFTFQYNAANTQNFTINVPFALLNLTLTNPLVDDDTQYFPCYPTERDFGLGRAFLQAAFIAVNWGTKGTGSWFLAQAPGPNYQSTPTSTVIDVDATTIAASSNSWEGTWSGHWTPLTKNSSTATTSATATSVNASNSASSGLSTGAKAGIGVGAGVGALVVLGALALLWRRHRNSSIADQPQSSGPVPLQSSEAGTVVGQFEPYSDKDPNKPTLPYYGGPHNPAVRPAELDDGSRPVHELQGS